jgi:hypothetical protein
MQMNMHEWAPITNSAFARDNNKNSVNVINPTATCWGALDAISNASNPNILLALKARKALSEENRYHLANFNDTSTHAQVLAQFDEAILNQINEAYNA